MSAVRKKMVWDGPLRNWSQRFVVRESDKLPADPIREPWWSGIRADVESRKPGIWEWRVWRPLYQGAGKCAAFGEAASAAEARAYALLELLSLDELTPDEAVAVELARAAVAVPRGSPLAYRFQG